MTGPPLTDNPAATEAAVPVEHFVTLFDESFLAIGLALYHSLCEQAKPFRLWVICMDEAAEQHLALLALPDLSIVPIREIETPKLLAVKPGRSRGEYCWTVTPFSFDAVLDREQQATRVTYLDSDVFFFSDPRVLLSELDESGRDVLITEHAYAPEYDRSHDSGRFCVQFLTARRSEPARRVLDWWQQRCLEWCFARYEAGKFGDQVYLDQWPQLFGDNVHIVRQVEKTLAPWNVRHFSETAGAPLDPVMYHFHGFRLLGPRRARLYNFYRIGAEGMRFYNRYLTAISTSLETMRTAGIEPTFQRIPAERFARLHRTLRRLQGTEQFARIPDVSGGG